MKTPKALNCLHVLVVFTLWTGLGIFTPACTPISDPYSQVAAPCMTQDPQMGQYLGYNLNLLTQTYLSADCKAALESVIPYDVGSFATAPTGMKDKVTEAFQAIIAYPLAVDVSDSKYLGVQPALAGAIPLFFTDIYQRYNNPNQSLFNYILSQIDVINYGGEQTGRDAAYFIEAGAQPREITIYLNFWDIRNDIEGFRDAFIRASTLAHEARHGDGNFHEDCDPSATSGSSGFQCDSELSGAYGFAGVYLKYLLHGSAACATAGCTPAISGTSVRIAGGYMCAVAKTHLNHPFAELTAVVADADCVDLDPNWVLHQEGLPYTPSTGGMIQPGRRSVPRFPTCTSH